MTSPSMLSTSSDRASRGMGTDPTGDTIPDPAAGGPRETVGRAIVDSGARQSAVDATNRGRSTTRTDGENVSPVAP